MNRDICTNRKRWGIFLEMEQSIRRSLSVEWVTDAACWITPTDLLCNYIAYSKSLVLRVLSLAVKLCSVHKVAEICQSDMYSVIINRN